MAPIHVNPAEAVLIHQDLQATASMAIHWGAFVLSAEGVLTPLNELSSARGDAGISAEEFAAFAVGETRHYVRGAQDDQSFRLMSLNGPVSERASFGMSSTRSEMMLR